MKKLNFNLSNTYLIILFLGVILNLKITNFKKVKEIRNKAKDYSKKDN